MDPSKKKGPAPYVPPKVEPPKKGPMEGPRRDMPGPKHRPDDPHKRYAQNSSTQFVNFMRHKLMEAKYMGDVEKRKVKRRDAFMRANRAKSPRAIRRSALGHGPTSAKWSEQEIKQAHDEGKKVPSRGSQSNASRRELLAAKKRMVKQYGGVGKGTESRRDARADAARDQWRRQAPEDR